MRQIDELIAGHLADAQSSWAVGTFGAIAEFHRAADEPVVLSAQGAITGRGGIRLKIDPALRAQVRTVAWERPTSGDTWSHGVAFCLPLQDGAMSVRTRLTELGPDRGALREQDRAGVLFDLGIGAPHCDFCVRTSDPEILRALRAALARPELVTELFGQLAALSPTRVIMSRLGRVEVHTPIPGPDGKTPDGPHTHVLPELLKHRRTHSANTPLPQGMAPAAEFFPPNPLKDEHGERRPFDAVKHTRFQALFAAHGDQACVEAKRETMACVRTGKPPVDVPGWSRAQRQARRVALRQLAQLDGPSPALSAWQEAFDHTRDE